MGIIRFTGPAIVAALVSACVAAVPAPSSQPPGNGSANPSQGSPPSAVATQSLPASPNPSSSDGLASAEPAASDTPTPDPTPAEPSLPPPPGFPRLAGVTAEWQGGCGALYRGRELIGLDDCGPFGFDGLIASDPIRVLPRARLVLRAPEDSAFSVRTARLPGEWTVKFAQARELAGTSDAQSFPTGIGTTLAHGAGPDTAIVITMPATAGEYIVQIDGPLARGDWTFARGVWLWLVRVV